MIKRTLLSALLLSVSVSACSPSETRTDTSKPAMKATSVMTQTPDADLEKHLYLEEVLGEEALGQVQKWNERSLSQLQSNPLFQTLEAEALEILNSKDKIPYVSYRGGAVHNFWQDADSVRGKWRTTTLDDYLSDNPSWETVLDYDALSKSEGKNWVYKGNSCLAPDYTRCIISLSDGGKDAVVRREFDTETKTFVKNGFITEESKGGSYWLDRDTLIIGVDFGDGTMTDSGYPMISKLWKRGTSLSSAIEIGRGEQTDVGYWPGVISLDDGSREVFTIRSLTFYDREYFWVPMQDGEPQAPVTVPLPQKSSPGEMFKDQMLVSLAEDWRGYRSGDLVSFSFKDFMSSGEIKDIHLVVSPDEKSSIEGYGVTKSKVLVSQFSDVTGAAYAYDWDGENWNAEKLDFPANGSVYIGATNDKEDVAFISSESFLTPDTLWSFDASSGETRKAKSLPEWFDASTMLAEQKFVTSPDGTQVPYFIVRQKDIKMDGTNPTLLYGYGGFEISMTPSYSATRGRLWVERGGVYVLANIRGGGEYGPKWHQAGLKLERQKIFDDFIAVAEDLIAQKITSPKHLGIEGGSNGGLLMGVMVTQRPDLFNAVVCAVPLLDMMRYHTLLAGASWVGEYGDPDNPDEGEFLRSISPYHNVQADVDYPEVFFVTSTKDDRVHPGHARKMAARMEDLGHDFLYYENIDGGHSASANLKEMAKRLALQHTYLMERLK